MGEMGTHTVHKLDASLYPSRYPTPQATQNHTPMHTFCRPSQYKPPSRNHGYTHSHREATHASTAHTSCPHNISTSLSLSLSAHRHTNPEPPLPRAFGKEHEVDNIDRKLDKKNTINYVSHQPDQYKDDDFEIVDCIA
ncbi:hypothetical protein GOP47_0010808 [Adiantum capillus-veneris]|uniref:Uncharacterized protein n=1 Tax=Adiantum capillus-veneris TaxID=13818 RepID=A0A9D4UWS2_ADICA|nr:hypothetical protein GOP47_0010808 [Adiantum capillus-veneris]